MSPDVAPPNPPPGRNDPCYCGSGKKYKQCHLDKDEAAARDHRAQEAAKEAPAEAGPEKTAPPPPRHNTRQPWKGPQNTRGFQTKANLPRRSGGS
jgi:hypothetical protein